MCTPEPLLTNACTLTDEVMFAFIGVGVTIAIVNALIFADLLENAVCTSGGSDAASSSSSERASSERKRKYGKIVDRLMPARGILAGISVSLLMYPESIAIRAGVPALTIVTLMVDSASTGGTIPYAFALAVAGIFASVITLAGLRTFGETYVWSYAAGVLLEGLLVVLRKSTRSGPRRLVAGADAVCAVSIGAAFSAHVPLMHPWSFFVSGLFLGALPVYEYVVYEMRADSMKRSLKRLLACDYHLFESAGVEPSEPDTGFERMRIPDTGTGSVPSTPAQTGSKKPTLQQRTSGGAITDSLLWQDV